MSQLVLADRIRVVDLVSEDQEGRLGEVFHGQERVELGFGLGEALWVFGVDQEHDPGDFGEVVFPQAAGLLVAAEVEGREADAADAELFRRRVEGWLQDGYAVVLEHVQQLDGGEVQVSFVECAVQLGEDGVRTVVLPALSRPRKRSLACLFARPKLASMSQTAGVVSFIVHTCSLSDARCAGLTPIENPHGCCGWRLACIPQGMV